MLFPLISQYMVDLTFNIPIDNIPITIDIPIEQLIAPLVTIVCH